MTEHEQHLLPSGMLGGRLEGVELPDLMWSFCERRVTGVLEVTRGPITRKLYLKEGQIVFACSSDPNDRLGETLLRKGQISLEELEAALRGLRSGKRLGQLLVDAEALTHDELVRAVVDQVRSVVLDVLGWSEGVYQFHPGELPTQELITLQVHTAELLMQSIREIGSFRRIRHSVGPPHSAFELAPGWPELREGVRLTENEELLLDRLNRASASIEELCEDLTLSDFEIYRSLWAFRVLGLVRERAKDDAGEAYVPREGELQAGGFPEILAAKSRAGATGVLYASRRNVERSFHLDQGHCVFATSSMPDDGLVSFLLRRGVISLRDREETRKRLLSNKRVGTILRDMGVIDADDLTRMVREQLTEIVYDTFQWDHGEFVFVPGPLPSEELIHLDVEMASLVLGGIRRIDSWTRVIQGCGGVDNPLSLCSDHLDVLDRMQAGPEERAVVHALNEPQSPRRLCRELDAGNYRVCQMLWALKLLGGVETARIDFQEMIPENLPAPLHADIAAQAVGQNVTDDVNVALRELPDTADLISRHAIDAAQMPAVSLHSEPPKMVPKPQTSSMARSGKAAPAEPLVGEPEALDDEGPELLDLEELEPTSHVVPPAPVAAAAGPLHEADPPLPEDEPLEQVEERPKDAQDLIIDKFNAMHRIVYTAVRAEIGAGAVNFVRSCCGQSSDDTPDLLEGVELQADGSWNAEKLKSVIVELQIDDPWQAYEQVLDREFVLLAPHLGQRRAKKLKERIWAIQHGKEK